MDLTRFMDFASTSSADAYLMTMLIAMLPILELRAAIPFGVAVGLSPGWALAAAVVGNVIPVPFVILLVRKVFPFLRKHFHKLDRLWLRLETKAHRHWNRIEKYRYFGLLFLVALPIPGTGAWTGSLVAACLNMSIAKSLPVIFLGVCIAGGLMLLITSVVSFIVV